MNKSYNHDSMPGIKDKKNKDHKLILVVLV